MRYLFFIVACFALSSCASVGKKVEQKELSQFEKGKTTYAEVIKELGKPTRSTVKADGTRKLQYTYRHSQAKASSFIPFVGMFTGGADTESSTVTMNFDEEAILTGYSASQGGMSTGTGISSGQAQ